MTGPKLPAFCWSRQLNKGYPEHKEFSVTPYEAMRLAGLGYRMKRYIGIYLFIHLFICFFWICFCVY